MIIKQTVNDLIKKHFDVFSHLDKISDLHKRTLATSNAILTVNEIIKSLQTYDQTTEKYLIEEKKIKYSSFELQNMENDFRFWESVKKELYKS